jgi:uncharacterized membrane protein YidH (DUF202 family)
VLAAWLGTSLAALVCIAMFGAMRYVDRNLPRPAGTRARTVRVVFGLLFCGLGVAIAVVAILGLTRGEWASAILLLAAVACLWRGIVRLRPL